MKRFILLIVILSVFLLSSFDSYAKSSEPEETQDLLSDAKIRSAVLMEAETGEIIYSKNEREAYSPASVTKIMTLLLAAEALEAKAFSLSDIVKISSYAASMGGSQVFLDEGESISVEELI